MKTVQVSTVKVTSDVEVIFVNSRFAIKAMRAMEAINDVCTQISNPAVDTVFDFLTELVNALEDNAEGGVPVQ